MLVQDGFRNDSRVLREARSLAKAGYGLVLLALHDTDLPRIEHLEGFTVRRVPVLTRRLFRGRWARGLKAAEFLARSLWAAMRTPAHVYHAHHPFMLLPAVLAARAHRAKVIYDSHELAIALPGMTALQQRLVRWFEGLLARRVDRVIMSDGASRAEAFRRAHGYRNPIDYIYNCPVEVEVCGQGRDLRAALGILASAQLVVYTGNVTWARGLEQTIESMGEWPSTAHFVIIGPRTASEEERLRRMAHARGVATRLHFWGPVPPDEVPLWAAAADVGVVLIQNVSLSYYYSAPTKMFEMIMARVPQVASDFPEIRRVVVDNPVGPVGEVVDPADPRAVAAAVCRILEDTDLQATYRRNADTLARTTYNWATQERTLLALYQELTSEQQKGRPTWAKGA